VDRGIWVKRILWCVILGFLAASALYGVDTARDLYQLFYGPPVMYCGSSITPLLVMLLNVGVPVSMISSTFLLAFARQTGGFRFALLLSILTALTTVSLVAFGVWLDKAVLAGEFHMSQSVWWMAGSLFWFVTGQH
jgi:hypothetical protein